MKSKLVLIDGHSILNRAFYGVPDLTNSAGLHTNAVYGFLNILFKILEEETPDYLTVAFDVHAPTFRHEIYKEYKGTRKPMPEELREQVPVLKDILQAMNLCIFSREGIEADDILGTMAKKGEKDGYTVTVVSGDRDLLQLASDTVMVRIPKTRGGRTEVEDYHTAQVIEKYHVTPSQIIDLKGLMGDTSDNIPGAPGIGEKTAASIITKYHSIENAFLHVEEITPNKAKNSLKENKELVELSKVLATINVDVPVAYDFGGAGIEDMFNERSYELFKKYEFKSLLRKFENTDKTSVDEILKKITVLEDLNEVLDFFEAAGKNHREDVVSFDFVQTKDGCTSLVVMTEQEKITQIPAENFVTKEMLSERIKELASKRKTAAVMDLKKNLEVLQKICVSDYFDMNVAAYLMNPLKDTYNYDDIARDYLNLSIPSQKEFTKETEDGLSQEIRTAAFNVYVSYAGYEKLAGSLKREGMLKLYQDIELPLIAVLFDMERYGMKVDKKNLAEYGNRLGVRILELEKSICEMAGCEFNINSPKQLGEVLFEKMGMKGGKKTKTGYSTSAEVLEKLKDDNPIVKDILEYRQLTKLKSTYADGLAACIGSDNRIHSRFNQTITATGRISSTDPNLQNIPIRHEYGKLIRKAFVPTDPDGYIFSCDYSQVELRVLAHVSGDENMQEAFKTGYDIHSHTAMKIFHLDSPDQVTPLMRRHAKAVNFGIVYGISDYGLAKNLGISRKQAKEFIDNYFEQYPKIKEYMDKAVKFAREHGYAETIMHRRRYLPDIHAKNFNVRSFAERTAINSPIQGSAADIIKIAMINMQKKLEELHLKTKMVLQIHDELVFDVPKEELETVKKIVPEVMQSAVKLDVPLVADSGYGHNWYDAK